MAAHAHRAGLKRSAGSVGSGLKRGWEIKGERSVGGRTIRPSQRALITDCPLVSRIRKIGSPQFNSEAIGRLLLHLFRRRGRKDGRRRGGTDRRTDVGRASEREEVEETRRAREGNEKFPPSSDLKARGCNFSQVPSQRKRNEEGRGCLWPVLRFFPKSLDTLFFPVAFIFHCYLALNLRIS